MARKGHRDARAELARLSDTSAQRADALDQARRQVGILFKVAAGTVVTVWLLALGFWSGLGSYVPLYIAALLTALVGAGVWWVRRNLGRSEELGALMGGPELNESDRARRTAQLASRVEKGEHGAILAKAQLEMHGDPRLALTTLEQADLSKGQKLVLNQIRGMRAMLHLNLGEVNAARTLADDIELEKTPDLATRANLSGIVAEAWARSGNPVDADELLDKFDPSERKFQDVRVQLFRARAFAGAHRNNVGKMKKALKDLEGVSTQLLIGFVGGKRVHPLLTKEARKRLERAGAVPRPKVKMITR
ncbi:MAG: hypothetical protein KTR25_17000 [Myxococcales bacterium]|nr:hypothetical protein [Myxococcales bacterium]